MNLLLRISFMICLLACSLYPHAQQFPVISGAAKLSYIIIPAEKDTWGYDIYNNKKLFIHQPGIPAVQGNEGFATKADAEKAAKKVIEKIQKGENPPSLTIEEMKQMHILPKQ